MPLYVTAGFIRMHVNLQYTNFIGLALGFENCLRKVVYRRSSYWLKIT